jgi:hypothetical protein
MTDQYSGPDGSAGSVPAESSGGVWTQPGDDAPGTRPYGSEPDESAASEPNTPVTSYAPLKQPSRFRVWRGRRPFWGGLLVTLAGAEMTFLMKAPLGVLIHFGTEGIAGLLIPVVLLLVGLLLIFNPAQRMFYSVLAVLLSLASWVTSNLGGFIIGLLLGIVGGSMAFGWLPEQDRRRKRAERARDREALRVLAERQAAAGENARIRAAEGEYSHAAATNENATPAPERGELSESSGDGAFDATARLPRPQRGDDEGVR